LAKQILVPMKFFARQKISFTQNNLYHLQE
jgi:hypothetical protein